MYTCYSNTEGLPSEGPKWTQITAANASVESLHLDAYYYYYYYYHHHRMRVTEQSTKRYLRLKQ